MCGIEKGRRAGERLFRLGDLRPMSELVEIVKDVALVLAGGGLTYFTSIRLEKRERNRRKSETVTLLYGDIFAQLVAVKTINLGIDRIANAGNEKEETRNMLFNQLLSYADFYKRDVFLSVVRDLTLLPSDCHGAVLLYHTFAEKLNTELMRDLETKDLEFLKVATARSNDVLDFGIAALSNLRAIVNKITVKEAEKVVRKDLSTSEEVTKEAHKESNGK